MRKIIEQGQNDETKVIQIKKVSKGMNNDLLDQYKHNDYDTDILHNSQSNNEINLNDIKDLNIS